MPRKVSDVLFGRRSLQIEETAKLGRAISLLTQHVKELEVTLKEIEEDLRNDKKHKNSVVRKLNAILRSNYRELDNGLAAKRFQIMSQNEEDGVILALLKEMKPKEFTFVDIGCGRNGGNCGMLASDFSWRGLMIDASKNSIATISARLSHNADVKCIRTFVTPENINSLLSENNLSNPTILSLDIDSYDYFVLEAMESKPQLLILEYNGIFGKDSVTVPYKGITDETPKGYHGASLKALTKLAKTKGYRLILCDDSGTNAFYLREDVCTHIPEVDADVAFRLSKDRKDPSNEKFRQYDRILAKINRGELPLVQI